MAPGWKAQITNSTIKSEYWSNTTQAFVNYHGKKIDFETSIIAGKYNTLNSCRYTDYYPNENVETKNPRKFSTNYNKANVDICYDINDNNQLTAGFQFNIHNKDINKDLENITTYYNINNNIDSAIIVTEGITTKTSNAIIGDITYSHKFLNNNTLYISGAYINNENHSLRDWIQYNTPKSVENQFKFNILTSQIDFYYK